MSQTPTMPQPATAPTLAPLMSGEEAQLDQSLLESFRLDFEGNSAYRIAQNAVAQNPVDDVALDRRVVTSTDHTFSNKLDDWVVTNQKKSGRCWMFAGLNLFRPGAMERMNLKEFEFSQNYTLFWDKLERANYFLEAIIETADRPVDDRTVAFLLERPLDDGGQWNMFVNVVSKHGLVPKSVMPETDSSSNTGKMNAILLYQLRNGARTLRELRASGAPMEAARAAKQDVLGIIHRILCIHLGTPPDSFDWQWNDKDKAFHRDGRMTPREFAEKYVTLPIDEYVCLVHDPRESSPFNRTFTVQYLGNVVGGEIVTYVNVPMDLMKSIARRAIVDGEPVWFGCDVGKMMRRDMGIWDRALFDYDALYDAPFPLDKSNRLEYHQTLMTHAMLFTGVDVVEDRSRRWRVENSWGEENGQKGFYVMNDSWFDEYVFEIAARRSSLPAEMQQALELEPIVLPPWDPMGALA
jgi:bleomycin hydrolase